MAGPAVEAAAVVSRKGCEGWSWGSMMGRASFELTAGSRACHCAGNRREQKSTIILHKIS